MSVTMGVVISRWNWELLPMISGDGQAASVSYVREMRADACGGGGPSTLSEVRAMMCVDVHPNCCNYIIVQPIALE